MKVDVKAQLTNGDPLLIAIHTLIERDFLFVDVYAPDRATEPNPDVKAILFATDEDTARQAMRTLLKEWPDGDNAA